MGRKKYSSSSQIRRLAVRTTLAIASVSLCLAVGADAATPLPDGFDLQAMALAPADFDGGARVASQGFQSASSPVVAVYVRSFRSGARLAGKRLFFAESEVYAFADARAANAGFEDIRGTLSTTSGRRAFAQDLVHATKVKGLSIAVGRPVALPLGQGAFRLSIVARKRIGRLGRFELELALGVVRLDRAIGLVILAAYPGAHLTSAPPVLATAKTGQHLQLAFTIRNLAPPNIVGTPQQSQTLTADPGRWAGAPSGFTYQWSRCDSTGANCTTISGAVGQTYVLGTQDSGTRLALTVKASNSVSSGSLTSSATALVP